MSALPRLDRHLQQILPDLTRSQIKHLIDGGYVRLNGRVVKAGAGVRPSDKVQVNRPPPQPSRLTPEAIPLDIIYEDDDLIAINKPAGMVVHPAPGHASGTLVNALLAHFYKEEEVVRGASRRSPHDFSGASGFASAPRIVHRLDKGTSGVLVIAKNEAAYRSLAKQFKERSVEKIYLALVWGRPVRNEGTISTFLGRHPRHRQKFAAHPDKGRWSVTQWRVRETFSDWTLLEVHPQTGRTHQIRVHLAAHRMPIVGDPLYGGSRTPPKKCPTGVVSRLKELDHQALHAFQLTLSHPHDGRRLTLSAPLSADMKGLLDVLRAV